MIRRVIIRPATATFDVQRFQLFVFFSVEVSVQLV